MRKSLGAVLVSALLVVGTLTAWHYRNGADGGGGKAPEEGLRPLVAGPTQAPNVEAPSTGAIDAHSVVFSQLPVISAPISRMAASPRKPPEAGGENEKRERSQISEPEAEARRELARNQPVRRGRVQIIHGLDRQQQKLSAPLSPTSSDTYNLLTRFEGPDISECCSGSAAVPPDPHLAVGPNQVIATVNSAIAIYDKHGNVLAGPVDANAFFSVASGCSGVFDPTVEYDESADRFVMNYDASPNDCIAVSTSSNPVGSWYLYAFGTSIDSSQGDFFDYPHIGTGDQAIYLGANIFFGNGDFAGRVWALNKSVMYAGTTLTINAPHDLIDTVSGYADGTPTPMQLHGSASVPGTHYIVTDDPSFSGNTFGIWRWDDPTGVSAPVLVGYADLATATGVNAQFPIDQVQLGAPIKVQANDVRTLDAEWRNGHLWLAHQMSCNIGSGAQGCARWAEVDPVDAGVLQAGVVAMDGKSISFPNLAVNADDDMALGFTVTGPATRPSVYVAARLGNDPLNTLRDALEVRSGDTIYNAFDGSPTRWGDYSGMAADPDGQHLWYLGEYAKGGIGEPYSPDEYGNWGTYVQQIGFGLDDHLFANGFDPPSASLQLHAEVNFDDADTIPATVLIGNAVNLRYVVINTGQQSVTGIQVNDDQLGSIGCPSSSLDAGDSMICDVSAGTASSGQFTHNATVTGTATDTSSVVATDSSHYVGMPALAGTTCTSAGGDGCPEALQDATVDAQNNVTYGLSTSGFTVSGCGTVDDVNAGLSIDHTYDGDLYILLESPNGVYSRLYANPVGGTGSCSRNNVLVLLDDYAINGNIDSQCGNGNPAIAGQFTPSTTLSAFNGDTGNGTWTLFVYDLGPGDTGTLNDWSLQLTCH